MTTQREPSGQRDDAPLQVIAHRLHKVEAPNHANGSSGFGVPGHTRTASHSSAGSIPRKSVSLRQVILVDREIDALRDVAIALRDEYDFHITISGTEALNLLRGGGIDTIVVGQTLYSSTGLNVLAEARHHAPDTHRVLLANAVEAGAIERGAASVAPFKVLQRPCTSENLRELLEAAHVPPPAMSTPVAVRTQIARPETNDHSEVEHVVLETMPELPRRKAAPRRDIQDLAASLPVVVYTDDGDFYQSIVRALQDRHEVRLCTQLERAAEMAEQGQCPLIITDRAATQVELQRISIALRALDAGVQTIASGTSDVGAALRKLLGTGALHSFLPKPINAPLVRLSVEGAKRQYLQYKSLQESQPELKTTLAKSPLAARRAQPPVFMPGFNRDFAIEDSPLWRRFALPTSIAVLAIACGIGGWYWWSSQHESNSATESASIARELDLGRQALAEDRIIRPNNDNALYYFALAARRSPLDAEATSGLQQAVDRGIEQAEQALLREQLDDAASAVAAVRVAQPTNKRLSFLQSQIDKERARRTAARDTRPSAAVADIGTQRVQPSVEAEMSGSPSANRWLATARQRMAQNRLIAPEADSAEYYFRQADRTDPGNAAARQGLREVGVRLLDDARAAASRQQFDQARRALADAARFDVSVAVLERAQREVDAAANSVARGNYLRLSLQRTRDNQLYEPERDSAKYYLVQLQRIDPASAETQQAAQALALRLIDNANVAVQQKQLNNAAQLLNETRRLGFAGPELAAAEGRLRDARSPVAAASSLVARAPATPPRPVKTVPPRFPEDAMKAGVQGWVDVGFRILPNGDVVDVVALASSPSGRFSTQFERAAVAALRQYKYEPQTAGTESEPRSMVQKVMFKLAN